jgi:lysophospholipase L1-like esterase
MMKLKAFTGIGILLLFLQSDCVAQGADLTVKFSVKKYPFVHPERNEIVNAQVLNPFLEQLKILKQGDSNRVSIFQIGDSHLQADFISAKARTDFQNDFGNAGRGLVVPLKVAGTNEPFNYKITSTVVCTSKRCVFVNNPMPIGIGGVTIQSFTDSTYFNIRAFDYAPLNYSFNKISLFYQKDSSAYNFNVTDTSGNMLGFMSNNSTSAYPFLSTTLLTQNTNYIVLKAEKTDTFQNNATIYGLSLENDSNGVIYNSVGVNGAEAFEYARAQYFAEQTQALHPQLIIISLGTNEAQRSPFDTELTRLQLDSLVQQLQQYNPNVPILLTTPPDSYIRKKYYNPNVSKMHEVIVEYAQEHNLAVWDLFSIAGGYKSCVYWRKYGLMRADGVHFTRTGYEFQGNLMYEAIIKAYNQYVSAKH